LIKTKKTHSIANADAAATQQTSQFPNTRREFPVGRGLTLENNGRVTGILFRLLYDLRSNIKIGFGAMHLGLPLVRGVACYWLY
jgi:hypothetical protein